MFKIGTLAAALVAVGMFSSSAFAMGGDGGAWQRTQHTTTGVCVPVLGTCPAPAKHHVVKHKHHAKHHVAKKHHAKHKHHVVKKSAAKSCVYFVDHGHGHLKLPLTAANFGGC